MVGRTATPELMPISRLEVLRQLERKIAEAGGLCAAARGLGISPQLLSAVMLEKRNPSKKILAALGITRTLAYFVEGPRK